MLRIVIVLHNAENIDYGRTFEWGYNLYSSFKALKKCYSTLLNNAQFISKIGEFQKQNISFVRSKIARTFYLYCPELCVMLFNDVSCIAISNKLSFPTSQRAIYVIFMMYVENSFTLIFILVVVL